MALIKISYSKNLTCTTSGITISINSSAAALVDLWPLLLVDDYLVFLDLRLRPHATSTPIAELPLVRNDLNVLLFVAVPLLDFFHHHATLSVVALVWHRLFILFHTATIRVDEPAVAKVV